MIELLSSGEPIKPEEITLCQLDTPGPSLLDAFKVCFPPCKSTGREKKEEERFLHDFENTCMLIQHDVVNCVHMFCLPQEACMQLFILAPGYSLRLACRLLSRVGQYSIYACLFITLIISRFIYKYSCFALACAVSMGYFYGSV